MRASKPKILIELTYHEAKRNGFTTQEAHYAGTGTLPNGETVNTASSTWNNAITRARAAAASKLTPGDPNEWSVAWEWAPDGRKGFPKDVELKIRVEEDKNAEIVAERKAQADRLRAVAEEIKKTATPPDGYTWEIHEPEQDYDVGDRLWLYAKKGEVCIALSFAHKANKYGPGYEIWIEGPGYGREVHRCKANTKGPWVDKAVSFITNHIAREARKLNNEIASKQHASEKEALRNEIVAATPGAVALYDHGIAFGAKYSANTAHIRSTSNTGTHIDLELTLDLDDAKAIIRLAAEACARRKTRLEEAARAATAPAPTQG